MAVYSPLEECFDCSKLARTSVRQDCGNAIGARAWLPKCFIRYDNYSFIGILDTNTKTAYNGEEVRVEPGEFSTAVWGFLAKLSIEAVGSPRRYYSGSTTTSKFQQIYGLVQCWSDLTSVQDCETCLWNAIVELLNVTGDGTHLGGEAASGSCVARYETYTFFNPASAPSQPPVQLLSPPSPLKPSTMLRNIL
ncbi:cysteine-rich receptor-like protein kinase 25 [Cryptomeria japonica]|uniref:cysteine-rich receptor-like protein kinase 25 n=1 Tax=Cryptomeria japonica TaxID=3369 RepID=UPI0027DA470D|nr:cysteine-rich receptor-like protein kinase 25 [Cryptomeria japonica]